MVILLAGMAFTLFSQLQPSATGISLVKPGVAMGTFGPIQIDAAPELAAHGYRCKYLSRAFSGEQSFFVRRERHTVQIQLTATKTPLDQHGISYKLFGEDGNELSAGPLKLVSLESNESGIFGIEDAAVVRAKKIVIYKK